MTATLADVRTAIRDTLADALPDVNCYRLPVDNPVAPALIVAGLSIVPDVLGFGVSSLTVDLYAAVSRKNSDLIDDLDALVGPSSGSAWAALAADPSLGDVVGACTVTAVGDYRELVMADVSYYAATLTLEVLL